MSVAMAIAVAAALTGSAIVGGIFLAFSSFIMKALARLPSAEGIRAMQSINVVVLNPLFLGIFTGTALVCMLVAALAILDWQAAGSAWFVGATIAYVCGTFLVTGLGNVPLNNRLAAVEASDESASPVWQDYLSRWTRLNTIRTMAALVAVMLFLAGMGAY